MFKRYATEIAAKAAIKKAGLSGMTVEYPIKDSDATQKRGIEPMVFTVDADDMREIWSRGFNACVNTAKAAQ